ncbi:hypothetical protein AB0O51_26870 [Streptomyces sp. NPDC090301]|uniref:hypothetical protein n=1 Tax=Streptomyces sp. NPDC090301 TaxID=3154975 RepID=UPI00341D8B52
MTQTTYAAAWVPSGDPARSLDAAAELATAWVLLQAKALGTKPVLVTENQAQWSLGPDAIRKFAATSDTVTSRGKKPSGHGRAVLAYLPRYRDMYRALPYARDGALAVVEFGSDPLIGWAMETHAVNLEDDQTTLETWTPPQRSLLEYVHRNGNNGWANGFGAENAASQLRELIAGGVDQDIILGFMVARGHDEESLERLAAIIKEIL